MPVGESVTLRSVVAYAVDEAIEAAADGGEASIHFVVAESGRLVDPGGDTELAADADLLDRVELWAEEDLGDAEGRPSVTIETAVVGSEEYLFGPDQYADAIVEYLHQEGLDRIVLDPQYDPGTSAPMIWPLAVELRRRDVAVEEAPVERPRRRTVLARTGTAPKYLVVAGVSFLFYQALGTLSAFDLVTGAVTAVVTSALLAPIAFGEQPSLRRLAVQTVRLALYVPYLFWEIAKANVQIAAVVLHPSLPIDPEMVEFRAAVWGDTAVTTLANSITLTPGTLTVDATGRAMTIHTLTAGARSDLFDGALERAVRFVFFGRAAARIPSPRERESVRNGNADGDAGGATAEGSVVDEGAAERRDRDE